MTELQKMIVQASNEAYKSDLMASFVSDYKGQLSQSLGAVDPAYLTTTTTGLGGGARFFAPPSSSPTPSSSTTTSTSAPSASPIDSTDNANANVLIQATDNVQSTDDESNRNTINANTNTATTTNTTTTTTTATSSGGAATEEGPDSNANMSEVAAVLEEVRGSVPETKKALVQKLTETTAEAHCATCINTLQAVREARARFETSKTCMPDMSKLSLSATALWDKMKDQMMPEMAKTITFFKQLAGFNELCLDDQMLLIKQGTFEVMMTRFSLLIDHEKNTMLDPSHHMVCPREVIQKMPMGGFLDGFFRVAASFNPIGLNDAEIAVFTAVLAFSPSRPGLKEPKLIGTIQSLYLRALFNLMKQNHTDAESKFSRVLGLAPMFRTMSEEHSKALSAMKTKAPGDFAKQFTPVHTEMYLQQEQ